MGTYGISDMLKQLNAVIEYIEANLCAEFDLDTAAIIACVTAVAMTVYGLGYGKMVNICGFLLRNINKKVI